MTKSAFDKIMAGAQDALAYAKGDESRGVAHVIPDVDVRAIRAKFGVSREVFSNRFGLDHRAVQDWEQGRRVPDRSTRVLMLMIENEPKVVERTVAKALSAAHARIGTGRRTTARAGVSTHAKAPASRKARELAKSRKIEARS